MIQISLEIKPYVFFSDAKLVLGLFGGSVRTDIDKTVSWNRNVTNVTAATLSIEAHSDWDFADYIVLFQKQQIYRKDFGALEWDDSATIDVLNLLANGINNVTVIYEKPLHGATLTFSVILYITFEGEPPNPPPPWESWPWWWPIPVVGAITSVGLGIVLYKRYGYRLKKALK